MSDEEENEQNEQPMLPQDPLAKEVMEATQDERITKQLKKALDLQDDEIATLYPDRAALRKGYEDYKKAKKVDTSSVGETDDEEEPEDDYELPTPLKNEMQGRLDKRAEAKKKREDRLVKEGDQMLQSLTPTNVQEALEKPDPKKRPAKKRMKRVRSKKNNKKV